MKDNLVIRWSLMFLASIINGVFWSLLLPSSISTMVCIITGGLIGFFWEFIYSKIVQYVEKKD